MWEKNLAMSSIAVQCVLEIEIVMASQLLWLLLKGKLSLAVGKKRRSSDEQKNKCPRVAVIKSR